MNLRRYTVEAATAHLDAAQEYGPSGMADELILLAQNAVAWHGRAVQVDPSWTPD